MAMDDKTKCPICGEWLIDGLCADPHCEAWYQREKKWSESQ